MEMKSESRGVRPGRIGFGMARLRRRRLWIATDEPMTTELAKQYDPHDAQKRWLQFWSERGYFHSRPDPAREPFCIVIPPPNVTGALHMGHALNNTLQDVLTRWRRMEGYNTLWMPG